MRGKVMTLLLMLGVGAFAGNLPEYRALCEQLPHLKGWQEQKCEGMKMANPMIGEMVTASKSYSQGDRSLEVSVLSGMQAMMAWAPYQTGTMIETDESLMKVEKIDGFAVGIGYDKKDKGGAIVVQLAPNAVLVVNYEKMGWKEALKAAKRFDWKKLRGLFTGGK